MTSVARTALLLCFAASLPGQSPPEALEPGKPLDRDIQAGGSHIYEFRAAAGQYLLAVITARQTDLKAALTSPDGKQIAVVDALSRQGPEEIDWILVAAGLYRITVRTAGLGASNGAYSLELRHLRDPTAEDRPRAAAFEVFTAAENLAAPANVASRQHAVIRYEEALSLWRTVGDIFWEGRVLHQIAYNWEALGQLIKARDALLEALPLRRAARNLNGEVNTLNNLGLVYNGLGEPAKALEYLSPALELRQAGKDRRGEAITLNNIAVAYGRMGDPARAVEVLLHSLAIRREVGDRLGEAITLNNLGSHYFTLGDIQKALDRYLEALAYRREVGDRRGEAAGLSNVGNAYRALGEPKKAHESWIQSAAAFEAVGDRRGLSTTLTNLGTLGDGPAALRYLDRSLSIRREIGDRQGEVLTLASISAARFRMAEHRKARESAEAAIELARRIGFERGEGVSLCHAANADLALGDRDRARGRLTQATALFEAGGNRELESIALATLAQVDLSTGNLQQALAYSSRAVAIAESIRGSVIDPELRASFRAYRGNHYGLQVDILMSLHQQTPSGGFDIQAMEASERSRARSLIEMLAESLFRGSDSHYATAQYSTALGQERIQREILDRDTALIEFALGEQKSYVWVVTPNGSVSAVLPPRKQIEQRVEAYRKELAQGSSALTVRTALVRLDALGAQLYRDLLAPVETAFGTAGRLIIVPDGMLAYLPFETLGGDRRLIERFAISYSPSASALATLRNRLKESVPPPKALLAFGDALYAPPGVGRQSERGLGFTQLPHTRTEVTAIRSLFPAGGSRVYLGAEARKDTVQAEQLDQYRFVHFAVHGRYDEEHPARSGIALSQSAESRQDGILQVPEIMRLRLRAEMVALSACQTGLGKLLAGEGVMGMSRAFLYAGADSVLTSLWNVNDASTAELMKLVYRNLTRGLPRDEALRAAKLQLMRGPQSTWRHPYHWAPFVLLGDAAQR